MSFGHWFAGLAFCLIPICPVSRDRDPATTPAAFGGGVFVAPWLTSGSADLQVLPAEGRPLEEPTNEFEKMTRCEIDEIVKWRLHRFPVPKSNVRRKHAPERLIEASYCGGSYRWG